jgi:hypothetical protein
MLNLDSVSSESSTSTWSVRIREQNDENTKQSSTFSFNALTICCASVTSPHVPKKKPYFLSPFRNLNRHSGISTNFKRMKEFALIFRLSNIADFKPSPEQMQERMNWLAGIAAQNKLADKGNTLLPVSGSAKTVKPNHVVTDGPYSEIKEFISGYVVVKAETIDEAVEMAKGNPIFKVGGNIEVREVLKRD